MTAPYRVLVTGSRNWTDAETICAALHNVRLGQGAHGLTVVHGDCPTGADAHAKAWAHLHDHLNVTEEAHPAQWRTNGRLDRSAGFRRNAHMVNLGANICLAFIRNSSRGATHTANLADQAGIPVRLWTA